MAKWFKKKWHLIGFLTLILAGVVGGLSFLTPQGHAAPGVAQLTTFSEFKQPTETVPGQSATIDATAFASRVAPALNDVATADLSEKKISVWTVTDAAKGNQPAATTFMTDRGVVQNAYYTSFAQAGDRDNYTTLIRFNDGFAKDGATFTFYYDHAGSYVDSDGKSQTMGAYVELSNIVYTAGNATGGSGNAEPPFIVLTNSLYSGIYYNKIKSVDVKITYVDGTNTHVINVQNNAYNKSYLTFASLNAHLQGDEPASPSSGAEWVTWHGQRATAAENAGELADDTAVALVTPNNGKDMTYYGFDTGWEGSNYATDYIGAPRFNESAVSFQLGFPSSEDREWTAASFTVGSETDGVWQPFLSYSIEDISGIPSAFSPDPVKHITFADNVTGFPNELDNQELPADAKDFWYWLYVPTYELTTAVTNKPNQIVVRDTLPKDAYLASDQVIFNTGDGTANTDAIKVTYLTETGWQTMPEVEYPDGSRRPIRNYTVVPESDYSVAITFTENAVAKLQFTKPIVSGDDPATAARLAIGLNVKQQVNPLPDGSSGAYTNQATVDFNYGTRTLTGTTNTVTHYRRGWGDFTIRKVNASDKSPLAGATFSFKDASGTEIMPVIVDGSAGGEPGQFTWRNLLPGTYTFKEETSPEDYFIDPRTYTLVISTDYTYTITPADTTNTLVVDSKVDVVGGVNASATYTFTNPHEPWVAPSIDLVKVDSEDASAILSESVFKVQQVTDLAGALTGTNILNTWELSDQPDNKGHHQMLRLGEGNYVVSETTAPTGYGRDTATYYFTIDDGELTSPTLSSNPNKLVAFTDSWITDDSEKETVGGESVVQHHYTVAFPNQAKAVFPLTGGKGIMAIVWAAGLLLVLSGILWALCRKLK